MAADLDGAWLVVAAATPEVNREVAAAAEARQIFVNAVDDPANASAFLSGTVRRDGVTIAVSTSGAAPGADRAAARGARQPSCRPISIGGWRRRDGSAAIWRRDGVPMAARKPRLLQALNGLYGRSEGSRLRAQGFGGLQAAAESRLSAQDLSPAHRALATCRLSAPALAIRRC